MNCKKILTNCGQILTLPHKKMMYLFTYLQGPFHKLMKHMHLIKNFCLKHQIAQWSNKSEITENKL